MSQPAFSAAAYDELWRQGWTDMIRWHPGARHRRRLIKDVLRGLRPARVLDVGCGDGSLLAELRRALPPPAELHGADLSADAIAAARARMPWASFRTLDIARETLPDRFDLVVCSEVLEHLDDRATGLRNLRAMLAPGGHLLVTCPTGRVHETERRWGHVAHPTQGQLEAEAAALGLSIVRAWCWGWPIYAALKWATNLDPQRAIDSFASRPYGWRERTISRLLYLANFLNLRESPRGVQLVYLFRLDAAGAG